MRGKNGKAQKWQAFCDGTRLRTCVMYDQPQVGQEVDDGRAPLPQGTLVVGKEDEVVDEAQIRRAFQITLDKVIEAVQIDVGPKL
jgi:hypothetical protein